MKNKIMNNFFIKYISKVLPDYDNKGSLIYHNNLDYFLKGLFFQSSAFSSTSFTIEVFVQPLFIPADNYYFLIGDRLGALHDHRDKWWDYSKDDEEAIAIDIIHRIQKDAIPFLNHFNKPEEFISSYRWKVSPKSDSYLFEIYLYALVLSGKYQEALKKIPPFMKELTTCIDEYPYLKVIINRVLLISKYLSNCDYQSSTKLLKSYRAYTLNSLNLPDSTDSYFMGLNDK
jgi:hypothetical protein